MTDILLVALVYVLTILTVNIVLYAIFEKRKIDLLDELVSLQFENEPQNILLSEGQAKQIAKITKEMIDNEKTL